MKFRQLSPAHSASDLTAKQARFVERYLELGGVRRAGTDAALHAGYGNGDKSAAKRRSRELLRNERILSAIKGEISSRFRAAAVLGLKTMTDLCETGPPQVRLQAAKELIDRGYGPIMSRNAHAHMHVGTTLEEVLARLESEQRVDDQVAVRGPDKLTEEFHE